MREALRRALWILPTIVLVSLLAFWAAARNSPPPQGEEGLPLLFNSRPTRIETLAWNAALSTANAGAEAAHAEQLLVRLGGAALPHLLPRLDSLDPSERREVAWALMPVARRMRIREAADVKDGPEAEQFWISFWQDHFVDFKPTVTRRVTARFATRSTPLRREELLRLDTYALDEIIDQMRVASDPAAARRLSAAASHIAEKPWTIPESATPLAARQTVELWQAWWARHENKYTDPAGAEYLLAPALQTRYALWLSEALRTGFGRVTTGKAALDTLRETAPSTVFLFALGLLGGSLLGVALVALFRARKHPLWTRAAAGIALSWLGIPTVLLIALVRHPNEDSQRFLASALVLLSGTAVAVLHARSPSGRGREPRTVRFGRAFEHVRGAGRRAIRGVAANASTLLGVVFLIEYGFDLPGWGRETVRAVLQRDVTWLVLIVVSTAILLGFVHILVALGQSLFQLARERRIRSRG
jgi:peptide/nickel transport system permease protein